MKPYTLILLTLLAVTAQGQKTKIVYDTNVMYQDMNGTTYYKGTTVKPLYDSQKHIKVLEKKVRSLETRLRKLEEMLTPNVKALPNFSETTIRDIMNDPFVYRGNWYWFKRNSDTVFVRWNKGQFEMRDGVRKYFLPSHSYQSTDTNRVFDRIKEPENYIYKPDRIREIGSQPTAPKEEEKQ